jgi:hypothetical protein
MTVSKVPSRGKPKLCIVSVRMPRMELSETVSSVQPRVHKRMKGNGFGGNVGKDVKRMGGDDVREVRDYSNAVPGIRSLVRRCVIGWRGVRKSRGRVRT